ncbi:hypothetical protein U1Q18_048503 [Sarracenia purpurea var. burkii]
MAVAGRGAAATDEHVRNWVVTANKGMKIFSRGYCDDGDLAPNSNGRVVRLRPIPLLFLPPAVEAAAAKAAASRVVFTVVVA